MAAAAGDGAEARRCAIKAAELFDEAPALVRVLAADAAEAQGDEPAADAAYHAMLGLPEMRVAGRRGLMLLARAQNDREAARRHAEAAYTVAKGARWAWTALLEDRLDQGDWAGALDLVKGALERKIVSPVMADRARAALLTASAAALEASPDPKDQARALERAVEAAKLKPGFAPGVAFAARLLSRNDKADKAAGLVRDAWKDTPHPALALAYRDLVTDETPRERAERLRALAALNPDHRESRLLLAEQALATGDAAAAADLVGALDDDAPSARLCALRSRIAQASGHTDEARAWAARAARAPHESDWSDLDPEGGAFAYAPADWARLVTTYAETGELIHPRLERRDRMVTDLPPLAPGYKASAPFLRAAEIGEAPLPDDPGPPRRKGDEPESGRLGAQARPRYIGAPQKGRLSSAGRAPHS